VDLEWRYTAPDLDGVGIFCPLLERQREIEKFIIRQPPTGEKDDYDSENSWISDGLPSSKEGVQKILCFRFSGTIFLNVRNTTPISGNREIPWRWE